VTSEFEHAWVSAVGVPGWLTQEQARSLWNSAVRVGPDATIIEIGSHQGRSTVVLAKAAIQTGARVVAIDPFIDGVLFGGATTQHRFEKNIAAAGVSEVVELIVERSTVLRPSWDRPVAMVYVDGKHDLWTAGDDLRWADRLPAGAPLLLHDAFSSIGVTLAVLLHVLPGRHLRYLGRAGSLARFEVAAPTRRDRLRILAELPWFARNVAIKIVLRALRVFGYRRPDPY
jgi:methyltransferase family protein